MDRAKAIKLAKDYSYKVREKMDVKKVVLYGSQARGTARDDSDVDIAVIMHDLSDDYLELATELFRLRSDIDLHIEPVLLDETKDRSGFVKEILRTGVTVYDTEAE